LDQDLYSLSARNERERTESEFPDVVSYEVDDQGKTIKTASPTLICPYIVSAERNSLRIRIGAEHFNERAMLVEERD
jgi:hypothetical protein